MPISNPSAPAILSAPSTVIQLSGTPGPRHTDGHLFVAGEVARRRERVESLRELRTQLSLVHHKVGTKVALEGVDLDYLELIGRHGPLSPSALARRAGLHPATMTGVLDRLQRGGWVVRERDPAAADRRAVAVRAVRGRNAELELIADFLRRTTAAGRTAADELAGD